MTAIIIILILLFLVNSFYNPLKIFFNFYQKKSCKIGFGVVYLVSIGGVNLEKRNYIHRKTGR